MTTAQIAHDARKHMQLIAQLRTAHGFSETEARDYIRFCREAGEGVACAS